MSALISLISPLLSNGYFWGGTIAALGVLCAWIYLSGRANGKEAQKRKALKQELKERERYENGYKSGAAMSDNERNEWVRRFLSKK